MRGGGLWVHRNGRRLPSRIGLQVRASQRTELASNSPQGTRSRAALASSTLCVTRSSAANNGVASAPTSSTSALNPSKVPSTTARATLGGRCWTRSRPHSSQVRTSAGASPRPDTQLFTASTMRSFAAQCSTVSGPHPPSPRCAKWRVRTAPARRTRRALQVGTGHRKGSPTSLTVEAAETTRPSAATAHGTTRGRPVLTSGDYSSARHRPSSQHAPDMTALRWRTLGVQLPCTRRDERSDFSRPRRSPAWPDR
jgi:hypothetical protein